MQRDSRDYLQFGNLKLPVMGGLQSFEGNRGFDYATYDIATGKSLSAAVGSRLNELNLRVSLRHYLGDNIPEIINTVDEMLASGEAFDLIFVNGLYKGKYQIQTLSDGIKKTLPNGTILEYEFQLSLREYAERSVLSTFTEKKKVAAKKKGTKTKREVEQSTQIKTHQVVSDFFSSAIF